MTTSADPIHDQALAAFDEAARLVNSTPDAAAVERTPIINRVLYRWLGKSGEDWTSCGHLHTPQVCLGLGYWPGHLMCGPCVMANAEFSSNDCDWCGADPAIDDRVKLHPTVYPIGPAIVIFVFCDRHIARADYGAYRAATHP